jgi:RimJ/RimL family protein N-acetyltransferase
VYERGSGELIGRGGPSRTDAFGGDDVEIGWAVRQRYWGQGFGTEIGRACLHFVTATVDPPVIFAFTEAHNHRSRAVMVRLGMTYSNEIRGYGYVEGRDGVHHDAPFAVYRRDRASSDVSTSR